MSDNPDLRSWDAEDLLALARAAGMLWYDVGRDDPLDTLSQKQRKLLDRASTSYLVAAPGGVIKSDRPLTINQAGLLGNLINGVNHGLKMQYYPRGAESADHPMEMVLRAFTNEDGSMYPFDADIRDSFVWCSSMMEQFIKVDGLLEALDNLDGKHGEDQPIAIIEGV